MSLLDQYVTHFSTNSSRIGGNFSGLAGRIIRGKQSKDFETLSDDPTRVVVMLLDSEGLTKCLGVSHHDALVRIGYMPDYIKQKVDEGCTFKMVVFNEGGCVLPATWDKVPDIIRKAYNNKEGDEAANRVQNVLSILKMGRFQVWNDEYQARYSYSMADIAKKGPSDPGYMTLDRFLQNINSAWVARAFLYFTLHLRELYAGDGFTYENVISPATRGVREYFCPNRNINTLGEHRLLDMNVLVPGFSTPAKGKATVSTLPVPGFYNRADVDKVYQGRFGTIADEASAHAKKYNIKPSNQDQVRVAAFGIDCQIGFCTPGASLFVPGAVEDTQRTCEWLYRNLDKITGLHFSMDTHRTFQIFHSAFWVDQAGNNPAPFTMITTADIQAGKWMAVHNPREAMEYVKKLDASGKFTLMIWPYHTMLGDISHSLVPALIEAAFFHGIARRFQTHFEMKGLHSMTENYSVLEPEVQELGGKPVGGFNTSFLNMLMGYDRVYIFGQAKSHCVLNTLASMEKHIAASDPGLLSKLYIVEDMMSPVIHPAVDFPAIANAFIADMKAKGMNVVRSSDDIVL